MQVEVLRNVTITVICPTLASFILNVSIFSETYLEPSWTSIFAGAFLQK